MYQRPTVKCKTENKKLRQTTKLAATTTEAVAVAVISFFTIFYMWKPNIGRSERRFDDVLVCESRTPRRSAILSKQQNSIEIEKISRIAIDFRTKIIKYIFVPKNGIGFRTSKSPQNERNAMSCELNFCFLRRWRHTLNSNDSIRPHSGPFHGGIFNWFNTRTRFYQNEEKTFFSFCLLLSHFVLFWASIQLNYEARNVNTRTHTHINTYSILQICSLTPSHHSNAIITAC